MSLAGQGKRPAFNAAQAEFLYYEKIYLVPMDNLQRIDQIQNATL